jgi:hypothetical protein
VNDRADTNIPNVQFPNAKVSSSAFGKKTKHGNHNVHSPTDRPQLIVLGSKNYWHGPPPLGRWIKYKNSRKRRKTTAPIYEWGLNIEKAFHSIEFHTSDLILAVLPWGRCQQSQCFSTKNIWG